MSGIGLLFFVVGKEKVATMSSSSSHGDDSWERVVSVEENETRVGVVENHVMNIRRVENVS